MRDTMEMAREAGLLIHIPFRSDTAVSVALKAFEALVRADDREACAEVADYMAGRCKHPDEIADAIRARGNT
jgi:predicted amidohydrolase YtcJ